MCQILAAKMIQPLKTIIHLVIKQAEKERENKKKNMWRELGSWDWDKSCVNSVKSSTLVYSINTPMH